MVWDRGNISSVSEGDIYGVSERELQITWSCYIPGRHWVPCANNDGRSPQSGTACASDTQVGVGRCNYATMDRRLDV